MTSVVATEVVRLLRKAAAARGETFDRALHRYMTHRFLAWIAASSLVDELCLTGHLLLDVLHDGWHRHAACVDFLALAPTDPSRLRDSLEAVPAEGRDGCVQFDMASLHIDAGTPFRGRQTLNGSVTGHLGGFSRSVAFRIQTDGGEVPAHVEQTVRTGMNVAGIDSPHLQACTVEAAVAERLAGLYWQGVRGAPFEDIADLYLLAKSVAIDRVKLSSAIVLAFKKQDLPPPVSLPASLQSEFTTATDTVRQWKRFLQREHLDELISGPESSVGVLSGPSLEIAACFLREHVSRWILEIASPAACVVPAAPALQLSSDTSRLSTQQLEQYLEFHRARRR